MRFLVFFVLLAPLLSFGQTDLIDSLVKANINHESENPIHSILLYIENLEKNVIYHEGFGKLDKDSEKVSKNDQFKIASSTKLFVSTIILQLAEEGKLNLDDKAYRYLKDLDYLDFDNFHIYKEKNYSKEITIKQLLSHRSGLADIFSDKQQEFFNYLLEDPSRQFSPKSIVELYYKFNLNKASHFDPSTGWIYSDMNYLLIGLIIEQIDQTTLSESIRKRILEPLKMSDTYFEFYEPRRQKNNLINQYVGNVNFTKINTSFDWSGGGLVSTNKDLATFITALFNLKLINGKSLQKMIDVQFTKDHEKRYGLGIYESEYNGNIYYGHYGFYGTYVGYCPKTKTVISYCISQTNLTFNKNEFINKTLTLVE
ncbi:serine hydrolase domain-containing protein [uncultured Tenacibaculum sp.]|uniref:serine hydrolase domain-containing protein n=1 Tax=uncultured Tenacibaculum sp. TaxID=174713 RepID=UPI0026177F62|nr:serine hydrolase domain-containing protein [uncultured Tenacibaculum sp.]